MLSPAHQQFEATLELDPPMTASLLPLIDHWVPPSNTGMIGEPTPLHLQPFPTGEDSSLNLDFLPFGFVKSWYQATSTLLGWSLDFFLSTYASSLETVLHSSSLILGSLLRPTDQSF